jgi:ADP-ribosylglycohydrolase
MAKKASAGKPTAESPKPKVDASMMPTTQLEERFAGLLLGTAVGDALGLPAEGLSPKRIQRRWNGEWKMRLVCGRGMVSDDTDHAFLVAQVLLNSPSDAAVFQNKLAARLRWWFLGLPAGVGLATARACLKLWLGISPKRSGVASAGNGPAMRSAILGAFFAGNPLQMRKFVTASTRITHTDPRAETAALAVAEAAAWAVGGQHDTHAFLHNLAACGSNNEWLRICRRLAEANNTNETVKDFAGSLGLESGITGYAFHTVPVAIYAWVRHPDDFRKALISVLDCGGDTDTAGAIVGALAGASVGTAGIPKEWIDHLFEWPRTTTLLRQAALRLAQQTTQEHPLGSVAYFWPGIILRNLLFFAVVLGHGFRRLLPPY